MGDTSALPIQLDEFTRRVIEEAEPLSQNTGVNNLGFGWLYYGFIRNLRPEFVVAIGSRRGFMPFCAARALQDNGSGHLVFIDPSYDGGGPPAWGGGAFWSDPKEVASRINSFGLEGWITHLKMRSDEAFPIVRSAIGSTSVGVVIIDGSHSAEDSLSDYDLYSSLMDEGVIFFHDSTSPLCGVPQTIETLRSRGCALITLHREVGLTIVEKTRVPPVEETWRYLCNSSNRGALILPYVRDIVRPGDRVLDIYCGYSPLGSLLEDVELFGYDRDPRIVEKLRADFPRNRWEQIDERSLQFAKLPEEIDVLVGLGMSHAHAWWDPQHALDNIRYLLGRFYPRACLFETAADYHDADILDDLERQLIRLRYSCRRAIIETDMDAFSRREMLIAT